MCGPSPVPCQLLSIFAAPGVAQREGLAQLHLPLPNMFEDDQLYIAEHNMNYQRLGMILSEDQRWRCHVIAAELLQGLRTEFGHLLQKFFTDTMEESE